MWTSTNNTALRTYLNGDWLADKSVLSQYAVETDIKTRHVSNYTVTDTFSTTNDKVFLLTDSDVFGLQYSDTSSDGSTPVADDYTYKGETLPAPGGSWIAYDESGTAVERCV